MGFNLLALSGNHAFDLNETGIRNTRRDIDRRKIVHAGTGNNIAEASSPASGQRWRSEERRRRLR